MGWQPLLEGADRDRAAESVRAILHDLAEAEWDIEEGPSLAGGVAGLAVLHAYLALAGRGAGHTALATEQLRRAAAAVASGPTVASLYSGLSGVGWAMAHLQGRLPGLDGEEDLAEIDEVLLSHLGQSPWREDYDLIGGLVGFGVYALERWPRPAARACLERVVDRLAETAERRADGLTWWTDPAWVAPETREEFPRGYYNLGLAHGVPGVIALLGQACAAGLGSRARPLLDGAVCWLLAQQQPDGFRHWVAPGATMPPGRLAWCYGDPGVAAALLVAARSAGEPAWEREAVGLARRAAARPAEQAGVVDTGLCHGAAGLGHLFNRLFQATGDSVLGTAARFWFGRTLGMRQPGRGVAGFAASRGARADEQQWVADPGLLTGATGIALALLGATTAVEPAWDRMLLTAVSPADAGS
jgi:hypothetical protein